jgi:hypothetical protein
MDYYPERTNGVAGPFKGRMSLLPGYSGLYLSSGFRSLGMNLVSLFIPLYVLKLTGSLVSVFLFYSLYHLFVVVFDYPVAVLVRWAGVDWVGFLGSLTRAFFVFLLIEAEAVSGLLWWAAAVWGLTVTLTWLPFHYSFTIAEREDGKYGKEVSRWHIVGRITSLIGPVAGGLMVATLGFRSLFSTGLLLMVVSGLPLFFDTVKDRGMRLSLKKIVAHLTRKRKSRFWLSFVGSQLEAEVLGLAWPLFIFLVVRNYQTLGLIKSMATLAAIVLVWAVGRAVDRRGKSILRLGTLINSFNVLLRAFLVNPFALFLVDSAYTLTSGLVATPFSSVFYEEAVKMRKLEFMVEREFIIHLSGTLICLFLAFLMFLKVGWFFVFALGAVGILMRNFILSDTSKK